jgi:uncharacterized protein
MSNSSIPFYQSLAGGVLIGLGSLIVLLTNGKLAGISGMFSRVLRPRKGDTLWRVVFLFGLIVGTGMAFALVESAAVFRSVYSMTVMGVAGVLVGLGTRIGGGCTSGHGVCGIGLGLKSSLVATVVFVVTAMATVFLVRHTGLGFAQ